MCIILYNYMMALFCYKLNNVALLKNMSDCVTRIRHIFLDLQIQQQLQRTTDFTKFHHILDHSSLTLAYRDTLMKGWINNIHVWFLKRSQIAAYYCLPFHGNHEVL